jgi:dolichol-phosphate mannosyltransferase
VKLSVVVPAYNEEGSIGTTLRELSAELSGAGIDYELLVIDDNSEDGTADVVARVAEADPALRCVQSHYPHGYGFAVRAGLDLFEGDAVAIVMADGSDHPADVVRYHGVLEAGYDCAFGSRFLPTSRVYGYPRFKLFLNRLVNWWIKQLFRHGYNDTTNAFKAYRREVIENVRPLLSNHFNLTVELPLKAVVRGYSFAVIPISWTNRMEGESKLGLREMGSRYLFIVLYTFLEAHLTRGDYLRPGLADQRPKPHGGRRRLSRRSRRRREPVG